jgi:hypothetical protein
MHRNAPIAKRASGRTALGPAAVPIGRVDRARKSPGQALSVVPSKPGRIALRGEEETLEQLLEGSVGMTYQCEWNRKEYQQAWEGYLPAYQSKAGAQRVILNPSYCVAACPIVAVRKCYRDHPQSTQGGRPYFVVVLNSSRDQRPQLASNLTGDPLEENLISPDRVIAGFGEFVLCPNHYPFHFYSSLLIAKDRLRPQESPTPAELDTLIRFSILTKQYIFFNSRRAGASVFARMHAHVVDPSALLAEGRGVIYPLLNESICERRSVRNDVDVMNCYGIDVLVLRGADAPYRASLAVKKLVKRGQAYNIMISGAEVFLVPRNPGKEKSRCTGKKIGAYEMSGVLLVGAMEDHSLAQARRDPTLSGVEIFSQLNYAQISATIATAAAPLGDLASEI